MPDVEKVIKGMEKMLEESKYNDSVQYNPWADTETLEDALALLKAQEPREPVYGLGITWCGQCNHEIDKYGGDNYCPNCGRAVKWE